MDEHRSRRALDEQYAAHPPTFPLARTSNRARVVRAFRSIPNLRENGSICDSLPPPLPLVGMGRFDRQTVPCADSPAARPRTNLARYTLPRRPRS